MKKINFDNIQPLCEVIKQLERLKYKVDLRRDNTQQVWQVKIAKEGKTHKFEGTAARVFDYLIEQLAREI